MLLRKSAWQTICLSVLFTANIFAAKLTKEQKTELRKNGTITVQDEKGKTEGRFSVRFMPGSNNVRHSMKKHWDSAKEHAAEFMGANNFWSHDVKNHFLKARKIITRSNMREGLGRVKDDYTKMKKRNKEAHGQFGSGVQKVKNGLEFTGKVIGRTLVSVGGTLFGTLYGAVVPAFVVVTKPVRAAFEALVPGTVVPVAQFAWNGAAWLAVKNNNEPEQGAPSFMITYTPAN